eukprot:CAMPEP_0174817608 /NCGR_PEP_ID=MMETSP1107-20130205/7_1 /TAXON_ID=36770 /ORGANISM="Paraphysomonas vestita, Strain GFlagA" /LENGTH=572 /DNA_ID=CAMNT_0016028497 /DNA_START=252 /DNA_END=1967 /DNA_ORIENTATION=-
MKKENFFTALRFITLAQNGDFNITKENLLKTATIQYPPPRFVGVPPPTTTSLPPVSTAGSVASPQAYAISPEEQQKYTTLFGTYDTGRTGFLPQANIMPIFLKSGLDQQTLFNIWSLADADHDNQLTHNEFSVAFHLILCVSKKHLPLPQGSLPAPLQSLVAIAPAPVKQSIADAFGSLDIPSTPLPPLAPLAPEEPPVISKPATISREPEPVVAPLSSSGFNSTPAVTVPQTTTYKPTPTVVGEKESGDLADNVIALTDAAKKVKILQNVSIEISHNAAGSLKYLSQRLQSEKSLLQETLQTVEQDIENSKSRLQTTLQEISNFHVDIDSLRNRLYAASQTPHPASGNNSIEQKKAEKLRLQKLVVEIKDEISRLTNERSQLSYELGKSTEELAAITNERNLVNEETYRVSKESAVLKANIETLNKILSKIVDEKTSKSSDTQKINAEVNAIQLTLKRERELALEQQVEAERLKAENLKLKEQVEKANKDLALQIAMANSVPTTPAPPIPITPAPKVPVFEIQQPEHSSPKKETISDFDSFNNTNSGFDDSGFGAFGDSAPVASSDSGFGA